jgi:hypothetical protein
MITVTYDETQFALVPMEPTDAMIDAAWECDAATDWVGEHKRIHSAADCYRAMLAATPAASGGEDDCDCMGTGQVYSHGEGWFTCA